MADDYYVSRIAELQGHSARSETSLLSLDLFLRTMETREDFPYQLRKRISDYTSKMMELTKRMYDIGGKDPARMYTADGKYVAKGMYSLGCYIKKLVGDLKHYREQREGTWNDELNMEIKRMEYSMPYVEGMVKFADEIYKAPLLEKRPMLSMPSMPSLSMPSVSMPSMPSMKSDAIIVVALVLIAAMGGLVLLDQMQPPTGLSILPSGKFAGISFEMFYIIVSAVIIGMVVFVEAVKRIG